MSAFLPVDDNTDSSIDGYTVFQSELHNNGIKAIRSYKEGEVIFTENPLSILQSLPNRQNAIVCSNCHRFVGSIDSQVSLLEGKIKRDEFVSLNVDNGSIYHCQCNCGELYCSQACSSLHWMKSHKLLCTGFITEEEAPTHPLIEFKVHAINTNEIFLLVADIFASICLAVDNEIDVVTAMEPWKGYVRNLWHEVATATNDSDPVEFSNVLKSLVHDSYELLCKFLHLKDRKLDTMLTEEYMSRTIGMFEQNNVGVRLASPIVSQIKDSNGCIDSKVASSLLESAQNILTKLEDEQGYCSNSSCDEDEGIEDVEDEVDNVESAENADRVEDTEDAEKSEAEIEDEDEDVSDYNQLKDLLEEEGEENIFPPLDGTAFYSKICLINHSCEPNVVVRYDCDPITGLVAQLHTLRPIQPGEELVQSYIDNTLDKDSRAAALKDYGFICNCKKCNIV